MKRRLEYYLNLPYKIEIEPISDDAGGGFVARLSDFGKYGIIGDGETIDEALQNLKEAKKIRFKEWLEEGLSIPEPNEETNIDIIDSGEIPPNPSELLTSEIFKRLRVSL